MTQPQSYTPLLNRITQLENRIQALESFVLMAFGGDIKTPVQFETIEAVRTFLRKVEIPDLPKGTTDFLLDRLTVDWRTLANVHGSTIVFRMLKDGYSVVEARRSLR
jgi:hypothetical protein